MKFNLDSLIAMVNFLQNGYFDEDSFEKLIKTKGMTGFLEYQKSIAQDINIKEELEKVIYNENYKDKYGFYIAKNKLKELEEDINYMMKYEDYILDEAMKNIYKIIPKSMKTSGKIYLFLGGNDGGFTIARDKIYINYGKYINDMEEFIKILSHELYHSRKISLKIRLFFLLKVAFMNNGKIYGLMGKIIEEGIASLVQHGPILKIDDPAGTLSNRDLLLIKDEFELLNEIIIDIKNRKNFYKKLEKLNLYAIGYYIVSTIYNVEGVMILDNWTLKLRYEDIIKKYIEICNIKKISSGFNEDIIDLIIN